jgi:hypothetical protein
MDSEPENCYVVFKRTLTNQMVNPDRAEEPLASCGSYAEARQILVELHRAHQDGVIRFQGSTGGGD